LTQAIAGGPLIIKQSGQAYVWPNGGRNIPYNPDRGALGTLSNFAAVSQTTAAFFRWQNVESATISYTRSTFLPVNVNLFNFGPFLFPTSPDGRNAVIFDENGSIFNALFGASSGVLGFAGPEWINPSRGEIMEGVAFLNGGALLSGFPSSVFLEVQVHEFGHFSNLAHTVTNGQVARFGDGSGPSPFDPFGPASMAGKVETMYPIIIGNGGMGTPHADDIAILSTLYPEPDFFSTTGSISGTVFHFNELTKLTGVNVIARNIADPFDDAVSAISSDFSLQGAPDDPFTGFYRINGLTPGAEYAVFIDQILAGGFSTPPLNLPGPEEFHNGVNESSDICLDPPLQFTPVPVAAGVSISGIDVIMSPPAVDSDFDGIASVCDNCVEEPNADQADFDLDGHGDVCDNCMEFPNPAQADFDADGAGDLCDDCTDVDADGFGNPGFALNTCAADNCPTTGNSDQSEVDGDLFGDVCDNCPETPNFPQADIDDNGTGDACQPLVDILGLDQDGAILAVEALVADPDGGDLTGTASILIPSDPVILENSWPSFSCETLFPLNIGNGTQLVFLNVLGRVFLRDGSSQRCQSGDRIVQFALGPCTGNPGPFSIGIFELTGQSPPVAICVREVIDPSATQDLNVENFNDSTMAIRDSEPGDVLAATTFLNQAIPDLDISALAAGAPAQVVLTATDGESPPVSDSMPFVSGGEAMVVFEPDGVPQAVAGGDRPVECLDPVATAVLLDGTASSDADSTVGTRDDIVLYEWFEDLGLATESSLGTGEMVTAPFDLGEHRVTLRVTDTIGASSVDTIQVSVQDTAGPQIILSMAPTLLWPPNHRMVGIDASVTAADLCSETIELVLQDVASSEPDDASGIGDGNTVGDVQGVDVNMPDTRFDIRAERDGRNGGRAYTVAYRATDGFGNMSVESSDVFVPHDLGGVTEPLMLRLSETASGTRAEWTPVAGALHYNLVRGNVKNLRDQGQAIDLGPLACLGAGITTTSSVGLEDPEIPAPGEAFFYLLEFDDGMSSSSFGTVSAAKERKVSPGQGCP
jgi:hypothetical protein